MSKVRKNIITVYEHQSLKMDVDKGFSQGHLEALQRYYGEKGTNYFGLIHKGVKFSQYVGVIQVGSLTIEVLPKTDGENQNYWREILIGMLRSVGSIKVDNAGSSQLKIRSNSILDLYFELYVSELEALIHRGLIKQYRRIEENATALKGKLQFGRQLQYNLIHKERFYVNHQSYDGNHVFNQILYAALKLTGAVCNSPLLTSRIGALLLAFPEVDSISVTESTFNRLRLDRKSEPYRESLNIARMLLLNYHPDISTGAHNVLALMFDMNVLWERFILASLRRYANGGTSVLGKVKKSFWKPENGSKASIEPDIVMEKDGQTVVLDTKWKVIKNNRPSDDDLKQMYVYTNYYQSIHTALVYPATGNNSMTGNFYHEIDGTQGKPCSIIRIPLPTESGQIKKWQREISEILVGV